MSRFTQTILAVASAVALTAAPAFAQHRGGGGHSSGAHASRGGGGGGGHVTRSYSGGARSAARGGYAVRGGVYRGGGGVYRSGGVYRGGGYLHVGPTRFYRPYYTFRPRFSLGFGLWAGYPFAYNYGYYDPFYAYPYAYPYPYAPYDYSDPSVYPPYATQGVTPPPTYAPPSTQGTITAQPNQANMGGLSFDITPADAQLFVDGREAGTVGEFTASSQPMGLPAGQHHVEIRASGYQTMSFDVNIIAGQVIPYQGTLQR